MLRLFRYRIILKNSEMRFQIFKQLFVRIKAVPHIIAFTRSVVQLDEAAIFEDCRISQTTLVKGRSGSDTKAQCGFMLE